MIEHRSENRLRSRVGCAARYEYNRVANLPYDKFTDALLPSQSNSAWEPDFAPQPGSRQKKQELCAFGIVRNAEYPENSFPELQI